MQRSGASGTGPGPTTTPTAVALPAGGLQGSEARWAWAVFAIVFLVNLLDSGDPWLLSTVLRPVSQELSLTNIQAEWLATVLLVSYAVWSPVVGYLADRLNRPRLMAVGIAVWGLATVGTGLARTYDEMQLARMLVGVGGSTFGVIALAFLMDLFPRGMRAGDQAVGIARVGNDHDSHRGTLGRARAFDLGPGPAGRSPASAAGVGSHACQAPGRASPCEHSAFANTDAGLTASGGSVKPAFPACLQI